MTYTLTNKVSGEKVEVDASTVGGQTPDKFVIMVTSGGAQEYAFFNPFEDETKFENPNWTCEKNVT